MPPTPSTPSWPPRGWIQASVGIDERAPMFAGHFPGRPLLPGVAQLQLVCSLAAERYGHAFPAGVRRVKFRSPIAPSVRLGIALFPTREEGEVQFELRDHGDARELPPEGEPRPVFSEGFLLLSPARRTTAPPAATPPRCKLPPQPPVAELLPHRAPALFLQQAVSIANGPGQSSWYRGRIPAENFLVAAGRASSFAVIELAAQAAAVHDVIAAWPEKPARMLEGLLVGVREATFARPDFAATDDLVVALQTSARGPFVAVTAQVAAAGTLVADVELQIQVK